MNAARFRKALLVVPAILIVNMQASATTPDLQTGRALAEKTCRTCHQVDGRSTNPQYPILAGQHEAYLAKQLRAFRAGERRNPLMNAVASGLSDAEIDAVAAYFAAQRPEP